MARMLDSVVHSPAGASPSVPAGLSESLGRALPPSPWSGPVLCPSATPAKVATWHTKIGHLAYVLGASSILQSDLSSSRAPSESFPSQSGPAFLLPLGTVPGPLVPGCGELRLDGVLGSWSSKDMEIDADESPK